MPLLDPYTVLPAYRKTNAGDQAVILARFDDRYYGFIEYRSAVYDATCRRSEMWNENGTAVDVNGSPNWCHDDYLLDPYEEYDRNFDQLDADMKFALACIHNSLPTKKIAGIRTIRALTGAGLIEAKRWFEVTIPNYLKENPL